MALRPEILLQRTTPDLAPAISGFLDRREKQQAIEREQPLRDLQLEGAQLSVDAATRQAEADIKSKSDLNEAKAFKGIDDKFFKLGDTQGGIAAIQADQSIDEEDKPGMIQAILSGEDGLNSIREGVNNILPVTGREKIALEERRVAATEDNAAVKREEIASRAAIAKADIKFRKEAAAAKLKAATLTGNKKLESEAKKETQKLNIKRTSELSQGALARGQAIKRAKQFRRQLSSGDRTSGATRQALSFIPGVFTDQAVFDEKFNAFAEVAARQKLKASGETRPTDADVEGMKRAMFGIARDESVNIQLLDEFIEEQENLDIELDDLNEAKSQGRMDVFTGQVSVDTGADTQAQGFQTDIDAQKARLAEFRAKRNQR